MERGWVAGWLGTHSTMLYVTYDIIISCVELVSSPSKKGAEELEDGSGCASRR